jgi:two-component system, OmpR family, sensor histidine kinase KdpD
MALRPHLAGAHGSTIGAVSIHSVHGAWSAVAPRPRAAATIVAALAISTVVIALVEQVASGTFASPVYLIAVLVAGVVGGTGPAVATAVASFLLYDFLFVQPLYTLTVSDPSEWLNLLLFLAVAIVISRLAALQAERAEEATRRAREAQALFTISRALAASQGLEDAAGPITAEIARSAAMDRVWLGLGATPGEERIVADTRRGEAVPASPIQVVLERTPGDEPARWSRTHVASGSVRRGGSAPPTIYRARVEVPGEVLGSLWSLRAARSRDPDRAETRIIAAAADQLGQAVRHDRLVAESLRAEVARQSEALKTALLDSVSHDLRTPLATIRATAGSLLDHEVEWTADERDDALRSIDAEAERMNRLVRNLLDLSRIEGGALHPDLEPHDVDEVVGRVVRRLPAVRPIDVVIPGELPPVVVDDTYLDEVLTNLVENAIRYGGATIRVAAVERPDDDAVEIRVEDDGVGVSEDDRARLFEKFYRVRRPGEGSRRGMGIGLTVAQGLARAMGGEVTAGRSDLGGLAMTVRLRAARRLADDGGLDGDRTQGPAQTGPGDVR